MQFYEDLAPYYDFICEDRKKDVEILKALIETHKTLQGNNLLDAACGTGLEDIYLKENFKVTGIDIHEGVLAIARKRNPEIPYILADLRDFALHQKFDVIICLDAMGYLLTAEDLKKTLKTFYNHLEKGGVLIFYIDSAGDHSQTLITRKSQGDLHVTLIEDSFRNGNIEELYLIFVIRKGETSEIRFDKHWMRVFTLTEIESIVKDTGFNLFIYQSDPKTTFSTEPYSGKGSPIFVCNHSVDFDSNSSRHLSQQK